MRGIYSDDYSTDLNGMVEQQMKRALLQQRFWYTAWVNAGNEI
jgi:hypothetical protein